MTTNYTPQQILALPMGDNDANAATIGDYFIRLAEQAWIEEEGFSGKRPFGNSGWQHDIYRALVENKVITGEFDDRYLVDYDGQAGDQIINSLLAFLRKIDWSTTQEYKEPEDWYVVYFGLDGGGSPIMVDAYWKGRTKKDAETHAAECNKEANTPRWVVIHVPPAS